VDRAEQKPLRLHAEDADDLQVISSCLQDAIARIADMTYQRRQRRFAMTVTRFAWERNQPRFEGGERVRAGLRFENVLSVRARNIDLDDSGGLLSLLAVKSAQDGEDMLLHLIFGGGGLLELRAEVIDCRLEDLGEGWPTPNRPDHELGEDA
jgi:hypothetical protein